MTQAPTVPVSNPAPTAGPLTGQHIAGGTPPPPAPPAASGAGLPTGQYSTGPGARRAKRSHPAQSHSDVFSPTGHRAWCASISEDALAGQGGVREGMAALVKAIKDNKDFTWPEKRRAIWRLKWAHTKLAASYYTTAKLAVATAKVRMEVDATINESRKKKRRAKSGTYTTS